MDQDPHVEGTRDTLPDAPDAPDAPDLEAAEAAEAEPVDTDGGGVSSGRARLRWRELAAGWRRIPVSAHWLHPLLTRWRMVSLISAVVASVGLAAGLFFFQYRPDRQTDDAAAHAVVAAASEGAVAVLSYAPESVDRDVAAANSHLTGEFLRYYRDFSQHFVAPAVRQQNVKASATVMRAGLSRLDPDSAVVLLFVHQTTTSKEKPEPALTSNNVRVTLTKVDGSWLISTFEPI